MELGIAERQSLPRISRMPSVAIAEIPFGLLVGAALGAFAGPVGIVAGAIIGGGIGATLAIAHNRQVHRDSEEIDRYDEELGVVGGELGAPNLEHPPPTVGTYSRASMGSIGEPFEPFAEGPISEADA